MQAFAVLAWQRCCPWQLTSAPHQPALVVCVCECVSEGTGVASGGVSVLVTGGEFGIGPVSPLTYIVAIRAPGAARGSEGGIDG